MNSVNRIIRGCKDLQLPFPQTVNRITLSIPPRHHRLSRSVTRLPTDDLIGRSIASISGFGPPATFLSTTWRDFMDKPTARALVSLMEKVSLSSGHMGVVCCDVLPPAVRLRSLSDGLTAFLDLYSLCTALLQLRAYLRKVITAIDLRCPTGLSRVFH